MQKIPCTQKGGMAGVALVAVGIGVLAAVGSFYVGSNRGHERGYAQGRAAGDAAGFLRGKKEGELAGRAAAKAEAEKAAAEAAAKAVNPFGAANPLGDITTNPYEGVKINPFE